jgi:predicted nucleotidyltransferase
MKSKPISIKEVKEKTIPLFRAYPVVKVVLFGSYARDEATIE